MVEKPLRPTVTTWLATRLVTADDGRTFEVCMSAPKREADEDEPMWTCIVRFVVDGVEHFETCPGIDAFGALSFALMAIERLLDAREHEHKPKLPRTSDHGFPLVLFLDPEMMDVPRVLRRIDEELELESSAALWRRHVAKRAGTYTPSGAWATRDAVMNGCIALCRFARENAPYDDEVIARFEAADTRPKVRSALARIRAEVDDGERRKLAEELFRERKWFQPPTTKGS